MSGMSKQSESANAIQEKRDDAPPAELKVLAQARRVPTLFTICNDAIGRDLIFTVADRLGDREFEALDWVIVSWGGSAEAGFITARMVREQVKDLTIMVPAQCLSAATSMALSGDRLIFTKMGTLSALDCQLDLSDDDGVVGMESALALRDSLQEMKEVSIDFLRKALSEIRSFTDLDQPEALRAATQLVGVVMSPLTSRVNFEMLGDRRRIRNVGRSYADEILATVPYVTETARDRIVNHLCFELPTHGWPVRWDHAASIGLNAELATGDVAAALEALSGFSDYDGRFCCLVEPTEVITEKQEGDKK